MAKQFNPYIIGPPVHDTAFYGREKLINVVRDALSVNTVNLLVFFGQRRIGKTSLLQNLNTQQELKKFIFIYTDAVDLYQKASYEVLHHFGQKISETTGLKPPGEAQLKENEHLFQEFLAEAYEAIGQKRLVILLDEFDIFEYRPVDSSLNSTKTALHTIEYLINNEPDLAFVVSLGRGQGYLYTNLDHIVRLGHWEKASLLEEEDARQLITEPTRDQLTYTSEAVDAILELTAGHPYYTQLVCYELFNELQFEGRGQVQKDNVYKIVDRTFDTGASGFGWLWEGLSPAEKLVASLVAEAAEENPDHIVTEEHLSNAYEKNRIHRRGMELTDALKRLVDLDILIQKGPRNTTNYRYVVELIHRWICAKHPVAQERAENLSLLSQRAIEEFSQGQKADIPQVAIEHYQTAVAANPNYIEAWLALAEALLKENQIDESVKAYEAAYWLDKSKAQNGLQKAKAAQHNRTGSEKSWLQKLFTRKN